MVRWPAVARRASALACGAVLLAAAGPASSATIRIATFNARDLSAGSRTPAQLAQMARLLGPFDLVALQEVRNVEGLRELTSALRLEGQECAFLPRPVPAGEAPELALLWRCATVALVDSGGTYPDAEQAFGHDPQYAMFRAGAFDFVLVDACIVELGTVATRRAEALALTRAWEWAQGDMLGEHDCIIAGGFALGARQVGPTTLLREGMLPALGDLAGGPTPSTRVDTAATVDNLWISRGTAEWTGEAGVEAFDETLFANDGVAASAAVSDHRPVWATFTTDGPDDDAVPLSGTEAEAPAWPASEVSGAQQPADLELADLDGDGQPELLAVEATQPALVVRHSDGAGGLARR